MIRIITNPFSRSMARNNESPTVNTNPCYDDERIITWRETRIKRD